MKILILIYFIFITQSLGSPPLDSNGSLPLDSNGDLIQAVEKPLFKTEHSMDMSTFMNKDQMKLEITKTLYEINEKIKDGYRKLFPKEGTHRKIVDIKIGKFSTINWMEHTPSKKTGKHTLFKELNKKYEFFKEKKEYYYITPLNAILHESYLSKSERQLPLEWDNESDNFKSIMIIKTILISRYNIPLFLAWRTVDIHISFNDNEQVIKELPSEKRKEEKDETIYASVTFGEKDGKKVLILGDRIAGEDPDPTYEQRRNIIIDQEANREKREDKYTEPEERKIEEGLVWRNNHQKMKEANRIKEKPNQRKKETIFKKKKWASESNLLDSSSDNFEFSNMRQEQTASVDDLNSETNNRAQQWKEANSTEREAMMDNIKLNLYQIGLAMREDLNKKVKPTFFQRSYTFFRRGKISQGEFKDRYGRFYENGAIYFQKLLNQIQEDIRLDQLIKEAYGNDKHRLTILIENIKTNIYERRSSVNLVKKTKNKLSSDELEEKKIRYENNIENFKKEYQAIVNSTN